MYQPLTQTDPENDMVFKHKKISGLLGRIDKVYCSICGIKIKFFTGTFIKSISMINLRMCQNCFNSHQDNFKVRLFCSLCGTLMGKLISDVATSGIQEIDGGSYTLFLSCENCAMFYTILDQLDLLPDIINA